MPLCVSLVIKDEQYIVIEAYTFLMFLRGFFFVLSYMYIVSAVSLHIESNGSMILFHYFKIHLTDGTMNTTFI